MRKRVFTCVVFPLVLSGCAHAWNVPGTNMKVSITKKQGFKQPKKSKMLSQEERLAACYAKLLGIKTPRVVVKNVDVLHTGEGQADGFATRNGQITLKRNPSGSLIAHEVRHTWQYKNWSPDRFKYDMPHWKRPQEKDARAWSRKNAHKCTGVSQQAKSPGGVKKRNLNLTYFCKHWVKGTAEQVAKKYNKNVDDVRWVSKNAGYKPYQIKGKFCASWQKPH